MAIVRKTLSNGKVIRKGIVTTGNTCFEGSKRALVAGLNESVVTLEDYVFNIETKSMMNRSIRNARIARANQYLDATYDFQLYRGSITFGKPRSMTGREVRDLNRRYEDTFYRSKDPDARLWRWHRVGSLVTDKKMTLDEYSRYRFDKSTKRPSK